MLKKTLLNVEVVWTVATESMILENCKGIGKVSLFNEDDSYFRSHQQ